MRKLWEKIDVSIKHPLEQIPTPTQCNICGEKKLKKAEEQEMEEYQIVTLTNATERETKTINAIIIGESRLASGDIVYLKGTLTKRKTNSRSGRFNPILIVEEITEIEKIEENKLSKITQLNIIREIIKEKEEEYKEEGVPKDDIIKIASGKYNMTEKELRSILETLLDNGEI